MLLLILLVIAFILAINSSGLNGFIRKSSAQVFNQYILFSSLFNQEINITTDLFSSLFLIFSSIENQIQSVSNISII